MKRKIFLAAAFLSSTLFNTGLQANEPVKIGYMTTLSGKTAFLGQSMKDGFELALDHMDRTMAGRDVQVFYEDDQQNPSVGKQRADKLIKQDRVDFFGGVIWSNVLMAIHKPVTASGTFLISSNAGPSPIAGKRCHENFFSTSWQNNQNAEGMGLYMNQKGVKRVFLMGPNYQAGKDMLGGFKQTFAGEIVGEIMTKFPQQLDFSAELAQIRAAAPDAVYVFYPGAFGIAFVKQYEQAGLKKDIPLYSVFTVDETTVTAQGNAAEGVLGVSHWSADLENETNTKFVSDFKSKYGYTPSFYAAQAYDTGRLIGYAVEQVNGNLEDKDGIRLAMKSAKFASTRGQLAFGNNHFPIHNLYLREVVKSENGDMHLAIKELVVENHQDSYGKECNL